jgi:hypothetical protein
MELFFGPRCTFHLELFSEEVDPSTGMMLGNFSQAFTHMGFLTVATALDRAIPKREKAKRGEDLENDLLLLIFKEQDAFYLHFSTGCLLWTCRTLSDYLEWLSGDSSYRLPAS